MNFSDNEPFLSNPATDATSFQSMGGCSCKLPADALELIANNPEVVSAKPYNHETDDAAFVRLDD